MGLNDVVREKLTADGEQRTDVREETRARARKSPIIPREALNRALACCEKQSLPELRPKLPLKKKWLQITVDGARVPVHFGSLEVGERAAGALSGAERGTMLHVSLNPVVKVLSRCCDDEKTALSGPSADEPPKPPFGC